MTEKSKLLTEKCRKIYDSVKHKPVLLGGIGCLLMLVLAFFAVYFARVVYEPQWLGQIEGTLVLFAILCLITALAAVANRFCKNNTALLMTVIIFISGTAFALITPPNQVPDEPSHYMRSYAMGMGDFHFDQQQEWPNDVYLLMEAFPVAYRNGYPAENGNSILDRFDIYFDSVESGRTGEKVGIIIFQIIPYLPQALGVFIGRIFGADALVCYYLARLANLAFYCFCCYVALSWAKRFRMMLFAIMALPLTLFIAASCNNDSMLFGLMFIVFSTVLCDKFSKKQAIAFAAAFAVLCTSKASYIVFILLVLLMLGRDRWNLKLKKWQYMAIVLAAFLVVYQGMGMLVGLLSNYGEIPRTMEDSNPSAQLMFILSNPLRYLVVFLDTLRNNSFFLSTGGLLGWIDVDLKLISFATPVMLLWAGAKNAPLLDKKDLSKTAVFFITTLLTYAVVLTGMYLTWTPVTLPQVIGIQMRYVLPGIFGIMMVVAYWLRGYMKAPCEGYAEKSEKCVMWAYFVFALITAALLFAAYYFTMKAIVFVS